MRFRNAEVLAGGPEVDQVYRVSRRVAQTLRIEPLQREINLHLSGYRFQWQYSVIASDRINAFCLPGGKIGVFTGLSHVVRNDDQLAAVIGTRSQMPHTIPASELPGALTGNPLVDPRR